jgi:hypothetical protein
MRNVKRGGVTSSEKGGERRSKVRKMKRHGLRKVK